MLFLKLIETLIIPGGKRGDTHPLAESMVQTSRVDWSAEEHFKPHPWPGTNLKGLLFCPPRCQECVPINLGVIIITTRHPQNQQFFYCDLSLATSIITLGWRSGRIQNGCSGEEQQILFFQRDCWWTLEVTPGSPGFLFTVDKILIQTSMFS